MVREPLLAAHEIDFGGRSVVKGKQQTCFLFNFKNNTYVVIFQSLCIVLTLCHPIDCSTPLSSTISQNLLKFMSIESVMLSNHLILSQHQILFQ